MTEKPKSKPFGWPFWLLLVGSVSLIYFLVNPNYAGGDGRKRADITEAVSNLRQIGLALHEFEKLYGTFPSEQTAELVNTKHPSAINFSGSSSNAPFRQLFLAGIVENEAMFYARFPGVTKPDNDTSPGHLLEKGEVAFAYVAGLSTEDNPLLPVAFGPIIPGTTKFDPKPFNGKGVVLRIDNSVSTFRIKKDGEAMIGGSSLLSPENPIWEGKAPDIRYPDL